MNLTFPRCSHNASAGCFPVVAAPAVDRKTGEVVVTTSAGGANGYGAVLVVN